MQVPDTEITPIPTEHPVWRALARSLAGQLLLPTDPAYEAAHRPALSQLLVRRPAAVVRPAGPADVSEALAAAGQLGLPVAVRGGGHDFVGRSSTIGLLLDFRAMSSIEVADHRVRVGAGVRLGQLYAELAGHGRAVPLGCGPTVGVAGLALGGGIGVLGRRDGLTCDRLLAADVVLPDGSTLSCDAQRHPDLFWLLRGAGAEGPAIVTELTFDTVRAPPVTTFELRWPLPAAEAVVQGWQRWAPDAAAEVTADLRLVVPPDPEAPPRIQVDGTVLGGEGDTDDQLVALVAAVGAEPDVGPLRPGSLVDAKRYLNEHDPGNAGSSTSRSGYFARPLPAHAIHHLVRHLLTDRTAGQGREVDGVPWGGAYCRPEPQHAAFVHRRARFLVQYTVTTPPGALAAERAEASRWLDQAAHLTAAWSTGGVYPNFPEPGLPERAYYGSNLPTIQRIRARYRSTPVPSQRA